MFDYLDDEEKDTTLMKYLDRFNKLRKEGEQVEATDHFYFSFGLDINNQ